MRLSDGVEWGVHACTMLRGPPGRPGAPRGQARGVPRRARGLPGQAPPVARARGRARDREGAARRLPIGPPRDGGHGARCRRGDRRRRAGVSLQRDPPARPGRVPAREYTSLCGIHRAFLAADKAWRAELRGRRSPRSCRPRGRPARRGRKRRPLAERALPARDTSTRLAIGGAAACRGWPCCGGPAACASSSSCSCGHTLRHVGEGEQGSR